MSATSLTTTNAPAILAELARAKPHAMTMNLVVWNADAENRPWVLERAVTIGEKHPSRTIVLDAGDGVLGTRIVAAGEDAEDQSVRIEIGVAGIDPLEVCALARELLVPDIPTVLWWSSPVLGQPFGCIVPVADATVVDSSSGSGDSSTIKELARFARGHRGTVIRDLAWQRIHPWQDMVAHFFDDPHLLDELFSINRLHIASGSDAEALYLGGWLGSRLSWRAIAHNEFVDRNGSPVRFDHERAGRPRRVRSVALQTPTTIYSGKRLDTDDLVVRVRADGAHRGEERLFALQWVDGASLVERAILEETTDDLFETALDMAATLVS